MNKGTGFWWMMMLFCLANSAGGQTQPTSGRPMPHVGVFLPLSGNEDAERSAHALEFYKGMVLANEICTAQDSGLEFHVFDHRNKAAELRRLASKGCLNQLQMMIGPMRQSLLPVMDSLAAQKSIPLFNVLSSVGHANPTPFLRSQQSSMEAIVETCFRKACSLVGGNKVGIVYGPAKKDSLLAEAYRNRSEREGKKVVLFRKVGKNSAANLSKYLSESGLDSVSHLFVPNNEKMVRIQLLSAYGLLQAKFPVFISGSWLEADDPGPDDFAGRPFYFACPDMPLLSDADRKLWQSNFIARWGNPPGWMAWKGFDLVMMLSKNWYQSKTNNFSLESLNYHSPVFGRMIWKTGKAENQFVPLYQVGKEEGIRIAEP